MKISVSKNLDALRAEALMRVDHAFRRRRQALSSSNSDVWAAKEAEARRVLDGGGAGPLLAVAAASQGTDVLSLARNVLERADVHAAAIAALEVERQAAQARVRSARLPAEIEAAVAAIEAH